MPVYWKKKKKALFLVLDISTKKPPPLFSKPFQPPLPLLLIIITMSNLLLFQPLLLFGTQEYFHNIDISINYNVKYWKKPVSVFIELPCDGGVNHEGKGVEMDGPNKHVGLDNINADNG